VCACVFDASHSRHVRSSLGSNKWEAPFEDGEMLSAAGFKASIQEPEELSGGSESGIHAGSITLGL